MALPLALGLLWFAPGIAYADDDDFDMDDIRITAGFDVGAALPGSDFYSYGAGKAYVLAGQFGHWRLDWRLAESYDLQQAADLGATVDGQFSSHTMAISRVFGGSVRPAIGFGAALVSSSLATLNQENRVITQDRTGIGAVAAAEVSHTVADTFDVVFGVRAYLIKWEEVPGTVLYSADSMSFEEGVEPDDSLPLSASVGLRIILD
jgi:hypothetical protein